MVIDNKECIINGFEMRVLSGRMEIDYMSNDRKVQTEKYEDCTEVSDKVKEALMESTIYNLNVECQEDVRSFEDIKRQVKDTIAKKPANFYRIIK